MTLPDSPPEQVRVAVIAADPLARAGLAGLLTAETDLQVVAEVGLDSAPDSLRRRVDAQACIVDLGWESEAEAERLAGWVDSGLPLLLLIGGDRPAGPLWSLGAAGLLPRAAGAAVIEAGVRAVVLGLQVTDPAFAPSAPLDPELAPAEPLTRRELEVLQLLAEGRSNRAIGQALSISEHTVKFHVTAILAKLGAESRTEAAVAAARAGLIVL